MYTFCLWSSLSFLKTKEHDILVRGVLGESYNFVEKLTTSDILQH
jgi:hypothetical protein